MTRALLFLGCLCLPPSLLARDWEDECQGEKEARQRAELAYRSCMTPGRAEASCYHEKRGLEREAGWERSCLENARRRDVPQEVIDDGPPDPRNRREAIERRRMRQLEERLRRQERIEAQRERQSRQKKSF